jgi:phosphoheptose isomerase
MDRLLNKYPELQACLPDIHSAFKLLCDTYQRGGKVLTCGNGGSAADAEHIVGELMKGYLLKRPLPGAVRARFLAQQPELGEYLADHLQGALTAISLVSQASLLSATANDVAADMVYAQQVYGYGRAGDTLIGLSTSGRSPNVLHAIRVARVLSLHTIGLTGPGGGEMKMLCDVTICAPGASTPAIQELHLPIYHTLCQMVEAEFFA